MDFNCKCGRCNTESYLWSLGKLKFSNKYSPEKTIEAIRQLSKKYDYWVEIPKNASFALHYPFRVQEGLTNIEIKDLEKDKKGFFIFRDPIDRFKSMLSHYFIDGARNGKGKEWLLGVIGKDLLKNITGNNICDIILDNFNSLETIPESHHFNSQRFFIPDKFFDRLNYDVFNMNWAKNNLNEYNSSSSKDIFISRENEKKIKELYEDDFQLWEKIRGKILK